MLNARPVRGRYRRLRSGADALLIAILFAIPWIRIAGESLVLLDIPQRRFHVFGLVIFPQELYFLWLILACLALSLFFFTALFGRVWCGWACPQTVFTDLFAWIARRVQGWHGTHAPAQIPVWRRAATHGVWLLLSLLIGFHLVAYFHSPYDLVGKLFREGKLYPTVLGFHAAASALAYFDFVFLRQTFCKNLCPYARFQGVLFDRDTLVIAYDAQRGEPRGKRGTTKGDCVDCRLCVEVCPSAIDIRQGMQLECIACTQCIDACDGVMHKLGRAPELIAYRSLNALERAGPARLLRPRVLAYGGLLGLAAMAFGVALVRRLPMGLDVMRNRDALYTWSADGRLGNAYTLHIHNRDRRDHAFRIVVPDGGFELIAGSNPVTVPATSSLETRVFVLAKAEGPAPASQPLRIVLESDADGAPTLEYETSFLAPEAAHGG